MWTRRLLVTFAFIVMMLVVTNVFQIFAMIAVAKIQPPICSKTIVVFDAPINIDIALTRIYEGRLILRKPISPPWRSIAREQKDSLSANLHRIKFIQFLIFIPSDVDAISQIFSWKIAAIYESQMCNDFFGVAIPIMDAAWFNADISALNDFSFVLPRFFSFDSSSLQRIGGSFQSPSESSNSDSRESRNRSARIIKKLYDFNEREWDELIGGAIFVIGAVVLIGYLIIGRDQT